MEWYDTWLRELGINQIEFDVGGIDLLAAEELPGSQVGYSTAEDGSSLVSGEPGAWKAEWVVIGYETSFGDVLFASSQAPHSVYTAVHGGEGWEPRQIAPTLTSFGECLRAFQRYAEDRESPADMEAHPPTAAEQRALLDAIRMHTGGDAGAQEFWRVTAEMQDHERED